MLLRLYTVALNTFIETIRQPIYGVILLCTTFMLVLNVSLAAFTLGDDNKLLLDLGLSTLLLSGLFLASFGAAGVLSREIENKTVLTVISKPVGRPVFVLGKFAGLLAALVLAYYISTLVFILTVRHGVLQNSSDPWDWPVIYFGVGSVLLSLIAAAVFNFMYGRDFPTTVLSIAAPALTVSVLLVGKFDEHWDIIPFGENYVGGQVMIAAFLIMLVVMITAAVALAASTRCGQLMTLSICTAVLCLGVVADNAFGRYEDTSILAALAYRSVPNVGLFWVIDGLQAASEHTTVPFQYVGYIVAYAMLFTTGILAIGIISFQRREVG